MCVIPENIRNSRRSKADPFHLTSSGQPVEGIAANAVTGSEGQDANVASKGENEVQAQIRKLEARLRGGSPHGGI